MTARGTPAGLAGQAAGARPWLTVIREVIGDRVSRVVFAVTAVGAGLGYSVLLPFDFTQRVSFANWRYFGPRYAGFTVVLALGLAWVVTLQVYAMRRIARGAPVGRPRRSGPLGALAAVVSLLPSLLCCSPVVPTAVSLLGLPVATQLRTTGTITHFFATTQDWLLGGAVALVAASGAWSVRKLARARCLAAECCPAPDVGADATLGAAGPPGAAGDGEPGQRPSALTADRRQQGGGR